MRVVSCRYHQISTPCPPLVKNRAQLTGVLVVVNLSQRLTSGGVTVFAGGLVASRFVDAVGRALMMGMWMLKEDGRGCHVVDATVR